MKMFENRRQFMASASGLVLLPTLSARALAAPAAGSNENVVVATWGGDYLNLLKANIEVPIIVPAGGKVTYDVGGVEERKTKMRAQKTSRRGSMDVSMAADIDMYDMQQAGTLANVDTASVPRLAETFDWIRPLYAVPQFYSALVIVYNPDAIKTPPTSYSALLDASNKGRVGFSDLLADYVMLAGALGAGSKISDFEATKSFFRKLKTMQPRVYPSNEAVVAALKTGEINITMMMKARALQWKKAGLSVAFATPSEGAIPYISLAGIPKNAPSPRGAFNYVNNMLTPAAQAAFSATMGYAPSIKDAGLPEDLKQLVSFSEAETSRFHKVNYGELAGKKRAMHDFWDQEFKANL
ncbi:putative spermidine/putrescine transport system substrate-binding protein [Polaromonas sp. OV174]|uniref:extracellular solute-binding protein n=1 Tax=Polaromonas sp. OV174 TaxID=1855300 RepID=UPI0008F2AE95|nr:extracellular solute-binding protein [Polaromonas sp. OV174]SFC81679.1 putative spermidine/putrescine transport system substrate-binding protein [Polaromonas sp. OV174]